MVIPVPAPPTDNLYKFMSVFGLVLVVTALIVPIRIVDRVAAADARSVVLVTELLKNSEHDLDLAISEQEARKRGVSKEDTDELRRQHSEIALESQQLRRRLSDAESDSYAAQDEFTRWLVVSCVVGGLGFGMMVVGFWLWYTRVQKHQDRALCMETSA